MAKIRCVPCRNEMVQILTEDFGGVYRCGQCATLVEVDFDKNEIRVDGVRQPTKGEEGE